MSHLSGTSRNKMRTPRTTSAPIALWVPLASAHSAPLAYCRRSRALAIAASLRYTFLTASIAGLMRMIISPPLAPGTISARGSLCSSATAPSCSRNASRFVFVSVPSSKVARAPASRVASISRSARVAEPGTSSLRASRPYPIYVSPYTRRGLWAWLVILRASSSACSIRSRCFASGVDRAVSWRWYAYDDSGAARASA